MAKATKNKIDKTIYLTKAQSDMLDELKLKYGRNQSDTVGIAIETVYKDYKDNYSESMQKDLRKLTTEVLLENQKLNHRMTVLEKEHTFYQEKFYSFRSQIELHTKFMNILKKDWHDWMKILTKVIPNPDLVSQKENSEKGWVNFFEQQKEKIVDKLSGK